MNSDIRLEDEIDHTALFPSGEDYWHEMLFTFTGTAKGMDFLLQTRVNIVRSMHESGQWMHAGNMLEHETTMVMVPSSRRGQGMRDDDFIHTGHYPTQRHPMSDLTIERGADSVTWKAHGRVYRCSPPVWEVTGEHGGVDLNLRFTQMPPAFWVLGKFEDGKTRNTGGYDAPCKVEGSIRAGGTTYEIEKGFGIREHMAVGRNTNIIGNLPPPDRMYWDYLITDSVTMYLFIYPKVGLRRGIVRAAGQEFLFDPLAGKGSVSHTVLEYWNDPRSGQALASRWHLTMASAQATLDLEISAHGRSYMYWVMREGLRIEIWQVGVANGMVHLADGTRIEIKDELMCIDPLYTVGHAAEELRTVPAV